MTHVCGARTAAFATNFRMSSWVCQTFMVMVNRFGCWNRAVQVLGTAALLLGVIGLTGCEEVAPPEVPEVPVVVDPGPPPIEAAARSMGPIAVCAKPIPPPASVPADSQVKLVRELEPEQWLEVMLPSFEPAKGLSASAIDCTGQYVFANEALRYGISTTGWPKVVDPEMLDVRSGPGGVQAVRLRAVLFENGDVGGPVALVRAEGDRAEVFGVGVYRGPINAKLKPVKMGNETMMVAQAKRCVNKNTCRKVADMYLVRRGRLVQAATVDLERTQRVPSVTERGLYAEYKLTTDVNYTNAGVQLHERVDVRIIPYEKGGDRDSNRVLRTVEFSRLLRVDRDTLFSSNESLWERVVGQD